MLVAARAAEQLSGRIFMSADTFGGGVTSFLDMMPSIYQGQRSEIASAVIAVFLHIRKRQVLLSRQRWKWESLMLLLHGENKTDREAVTSCHGPGANVLTSRDDME